jgi:predicted DNA-binding protein (UPF0251 family)
MPNRRRYRHIKMPPPMEGYKPFGVPMRELESVVMTVEEYEALRLADYEDLTHKEAAVRMNISRPTFTRLYDKARKNVAKAFAEGKAILIRGGTFIAGDYWYRCNDCHETIVSATSEENCNKCNSEDIRRIDGDDGKGGNELSE